MDFVETVLLMKLQREFNFHLKQKASISNVMSVRDLPAQLIIDWLDQPVPTTVKIHTAN